jgi:probable rRNA maturation factor
MKVFVGEHESHGIATSDSVWLSSLMESICEHLDLPDGDIEITLTNDEEIKHLNQKYRKKASPTNVLSFPQYEWKTPRVISNGNPLMSGDNLPPLWGEIIVSVDTVKKDAFNRQVTFLDELTRICIHGILHLFGYSHNSDSEYDEMAVTEENAITFAKKWIQRQQQ